MSIIYTQFSIKEINDTTSSKGSIINHYGKSEKTEQYLMLSSDIEWTEYPSLEPKYFSPDTTPGNGDTVLYSFAINETKDFWLNISAYYDTIDNYPGFGFSDDPMAAYLMPNGTWLVVGIEYEINYPIFNKHLVLGIGSNTSNFNWRRIGQLNETKYISVAGSESGEIQVAYVEKVGVNNPFKGIKFCKSENWGNSWENGTIANFTHCNDLKFSGLSVAEFNNNFTCVFSVTNTSDWTDSIVLESSLNALGEWYDPQNLTALEGNNAAAPQLVFNQTNHDGTPLLAVNNYTSGGTSQDLVILQLESISEKTKLDSWIVPAYDNIKDDEPLIYFTKDYETEDFYFLDPLGMSDPVGIQNATWKGSLSETDIFQAEQDGSFRIFGLDGSKCFTSYALSDSGYYKPGILDCNTPFNVIEIKDTTEESLRYSYVFDGKDEYGISRFAKAYSFNLYIDTDEIFGVTYDKIAFVDDIPSNIQYNTSDNKISPFSSLGSNDYFRVNLTSNKPGEMTFNLLSDNIVTGETDIADDSNMIQDPVICGDGVNYYMLYEYIEETNPLIAKLMYTKSDDGGLSWEDPISIDDLEESGLHKFAISTDTQIFVWMREYLYISSDRGESFNKFQIGSVGGKNSFEKYVVHAVSKGENNSINCWRGGDKSTNEFLINKSNDYGSTWNSFITIPLDDAADYYLIASAYDPISGNFSFLLDSSASKDLRFLTITKNGDASFISNNLLPDGSTPVYSSSFSNYFGVVDLDVRKLNQTTSEWIITSSHKNAYNPFQFEFTTYLAYTTSKNGINFNDWENLTEITGEKLDVWTFNYDTWDIVYPDDGVPCFAAGLHPSPPLVVQLPVYIKITSGSKFVYGNSMKLDSNYQGELSFYGLTSNGEKLEDGRYSWMLKVIDRAGYTETLNGNLTIDNTNPTLNDYL
ncbi:MAG: hypothetical protein GF383_05270, partial [Candidatus Lokiarchaeota archaeon]|nr:hypothetical protein [Candidatus Lokiarchaeota archaeon]MBD3339302.1 hypothetical protein [Candidatus Lokiarchaeota archaeon]